MPGHIMNGAEPGILSFVAGANKGHMQMAPSQLQIRLAGFTEIMLLAEFVDQALSVLAVLGYLVFQQHLMITAPHHAQAGRRSIDQRAAEGLAFSDACVGLTSRQHHGIAVPAIECAPAAQPCKNQCQQA